ncbi:MAG: hypothetical protein H7Y42_02405 [Chitinophagaceae bacterium]|nr:hypothetical protein [Chitinophagaceae bacterium]
MANYLLLRSNKESGPYSVDDLMTLGLKPYDLVWVQGKSAAWRYPSEVDELKPFSPVVEEQPFDRFFKKESDKQGEIKEQNQSEKQVQKQSEKQEQKQGVKPVEVQAQPVQLTPAFQPEHEKYLPGKSVAVTLPGQRTNGARPMPERKTEEIRAPQPQQATARNYTPPPVSQQIDAPAQPTITVSENPAAQIKYSQPLDEIKEMYVKTLHERKQKIARKGFLLQGLKRAAVIVGLVALGVVAGLIIKSNGSKELMVHQDMAGKMPEVAKEDLDERKDTEPGDAADRQLLSDPTPRYTNPQPERRATSVEIERPTINPERVVVSKTAKENTTLDEEEEQTAEIVEPRSVEVNPATGERNRAVRNGNPGTVEKTSRKHPTRSEEANGYNGELATQVSVKSNVYKIVAFGGIRDLKLTVTNDSKYVLDNVIVEVRYLKPSEEPLRTENIQFKAIDPNTSATIKVPDTNRGIKVSYRIINIKSRQLDGGVAGN